MSAETDFHCSSKAKDTTTHSQEEREVVYSCSCIRCYSTWCKREGVCGGWTDSTHFRLFIFWALLHFLILIVRGGRIQGLSLGLLCWGFSSQARRHIDLWVVCWKSAVSFLVAFGFVLFLPMSIRGKERIWCWGMSQSQNWSQLGKHLNCSAGSDLSWTAKLGAQVLSWTRSRGVGSGHEHVHSILFKSCIAKQLRALCREACWQCKKLLPKLPWDFASPTGPRFESCFITW